MFLGLMQGVFAADFNGTWQLTSGNNGLSYDVSFVQTGQNVEGTYSNLANSLIQDYGFINGQRGIYGTFDGSIFRGKALFHYPNSFKTSCPALWEQWLDTTITMSADGNTLNAAFWRASSATLSNCTETGIGWIYMTYTRKTPVNSTLSNNCIATYSPTTGKLTVPCVAVPVSQPFGGIQTLNYSIEMQQRTGSFVFDLDLSTVKQK
jgi:hypothetical protein